MHNVNTPSSRHMLSTRQLTEAEAKVNTRESRHASSGKQSGRQFGMNTLKTFKHSNKKTETEEHKKHKIEGRALSSRRLENINTQERKITDEPFRKKNTNSQYLHRSHSSISISKTVETKEQSPEISSNNLCDILKTSSNPLPFSPNRPLPALPTTQPAISEISVPMPGYCRYGSDAHIYEEISTTRPSGQKNDACSQTVNTGTNTHYKIFKNRSYRHTASHNSDFFKRSDLPRKNGWYFTPEYRRSPSVQIPDQKIDHVPVIRMHENPSCHPLPRPIPLCYSNSSQNHQDFVSLSNQISTKSKPKDHYTPPVNRQDIPTKTKRDYRTSSSKLTKNNHLSSNKYKHNPTNKVSLGTQKVNSLHERNNHCLASLKLQDKYQYNASNTMADMSESTDFDKSDIPVNGVNDSINSPEHPQPIYFTFPDGSDTESAESEVNKYIDYGFV